MSDTKTVPEAQALLKIAEALDSLGDDEQRCAVMAQVCIQFADYERASQFLQRAADIRAALGEEGG